MKEYSGKKYIYNCAHANELMQDGYKCLGTGFNGNSGRYFWVFSWNEIQPYYEARDNK